MSITLTHTRTTRSGNGKIDLKGLSRFRRKGLKDKQKARFYGDLHLLLSSGLDINTTFDILIGQTRGEWEQSQYKSVQDDIIAGLSLAESMRSKSLAGNYEYFALKIGEESGKIEEVLSEVKRYYERKIKQKRQIQGALTYPVMVLLTAAVAVGFMLNVIVPMFEEVFNRFQGDLPALTRKIIHISDWMSNYFWLILLALFAVGVSFRVLWKRHAIRRFVHHALMQIPLMGRLLKDLESARFCHIMALLTAARSPLVQSLRMVAEMIGFIPLKDAISHMADEISRGKTLYDSVDQSGFFDKKFSSLIKAGEEVNKLEYSFNQLNDQYNQETDHKLSVLSSLMEPLLIILVGGLVAVILIAMYLPLFQLGSSIY